MFSNVKKEKKNERKHQREKVANPLHGMYMILPGNITPIGIVMTHRRHTYFTEVVFMHMHIAERINSSCPSWHGTFRVTYKCSASSVDYDMIGGHDQNTHSCGSSIPGTPCRVQSCGKSRTQ